MDKASSTIEEASSAALRVTVSLELFLFYHSPFCIPLTCSHLNGFYKKENLLLSLQTMSCSTLCRIVTFFVPLILSLFMMISDPEGSVFNSKANTSPGFTRVSCKVNPCRCGTSGQCRCHKTHKAGKQTVFYCLHYTSPTLLCSSVR